MSAPAIGFWRTVRVLLAASRKRSAGRRRRQRELFRQRTGGASTDWGALGFFFAVLFMLGVNIAAAFCLRNAVEAAEVVLAERSGKLVVSRFFLDTMRNEIAPEQGSTHSYGEWFSFETEARRLSQRYGGTTPEIEQRLREAVNSHGTADLIAEDDPTLQFSNFTSGNRFPAMVGSLVLIIWGMMLIFQGEGLELDPQRRRHPMWEWLFSHPVSPRPVFLAEMLSPIAANPVFWGTPVFVGLLYSFAYGAAKGLLAILLIGVPVVIAVACLSKALEVGVTLRFPLRSRGAIMGLMGWMGYASMLALLFGLLVVTKAVMALSKPLYFLAAVPWPWLQWFLGARSNGSFSFLSGALTLWIVSAMAMAAAVWFSVWGAEQGLSGNVASDTRPARRNRRAVEFGKEPLYRKEFLWFTRDRSAIVQAVLIPLTVAGFQLFNLRGLLITAQGEWNYLCGAAILFGTYFLWILGPKSLLSEGNALWIALTWPRGLESLLKAKAWLWSLISSALVAVVLAYAAARFPASTWKVALVGVGWFLFARSMAEKTVTLVTVASESGERQPIPWGRRWAAQLGMLTFSIGVLTQQWHIAIAGIVYSYMTAAAMWQNFRARLPYLYDPWSEELPPAPTLMHAMIGVSILVEAGSVFTGIVVAFTGKGSIAIAQAISYAVCAVGVGLGMSYFLGGRDVQPRQVWNWQTPADEKRTLSWQDGTLARFLLLGAAGGAALGALAIAYLWALQHVPATRDVLLRSQQQMAGIPHLKLAYGILAVACAPFAEEYLFRGLLFRALDREWGGWHAVVGSAAFFAMYHPTLSWVPVGLLGATNAVLFKKTGRLAPAVVLHMVYNAVVLFWH